MPNAEPNELSERELDILKLVATGASNKEIAFKLFISSNTVKVHLRNIFSKIGVASRTEAAMYAVRIGLVKTAATSLPSDEDVLQYLPNSQNLLDQDKTTAGNRFWSIINTRRSVIYIILLVFIIVSLAVLGSVLLRRNNQPNFIVLPTPTPRVQWVALPGLPMPRRGLAVTSYEDMLYAIGGESAQGVSDMVNKYNPQTNAWTLLKPKLTPVTDINAAVIGGLIYIPGGRLASGKPTDITEIFDPITEKWSTGAPLPIELSAYALTVFEGQMYIFGGWNGEQVVNNAYVFDPQTNKWSEIPSMPTARSYPGAVVSGNKIYVIGGWDGKQSLDVDEVYQPDLAGQKSIWTEAPPLPAGRYGMGITNLANIIFIIGGTGESDSPATITLFPEETNWGQFENPLQSGWSFLGAATIGTKLYVLGGKTDVGLSNQMWSYQVIFTISLPIVR